MKPQNVKFRYEIFSIIFDFNYLKICLLISFLLFHFRLNSKPELIKGKKVSVNVDVFGVGSYVGIGRNKRFAKVTAAKKALIALKKLKQ
jgi:hypothetical protein